MSSNDRSIRNNQVFYESSDFLKSNNEEQKGKLKN